MSLHSEEIFTWIPHMVFDDSIVYPSVIMTSEWKKEQRSALTEYPIKKMKFVFDVLTRDDVNGIWDFHEARRMAYESFKFKNPSDFEAEEIIGIGNDIETVFQLFNYYVIDNSQDIYIDDILQAETADYTIDNNNGTITFLSSPTSGQIIIAYYEFYTRVRFEDKPLSRENFEYDLFELGIGLENVVPPLAPKDIPITWVAID